MAKFLDYSPDQAYLLPSDVRDVLGSGHLCFFVRRVVAKLNFNAFRDQIRRRRRPGLCAGDVGFGLVVRLRVGRDEFAKAGTTHSRRFGVSLFGGRDVAGPLDAERFPAPARKGVERFVHARDRVGAVELDWAGWDMWPSTRRASLRTLRVIASTPSRRCEMREREFGVTFAVGRSSATRTIRTKARAAKLVSNEAIARLEQQLAQRFPSGWSGCANRG